MKMFDLRLTSYDCSAEMLCRRRIASGQNRKSKIENREFIVLCAAAALILLTGCQPQMKSPELICPGKATAAEAVAVLRQKQSGPLSLQAGIHCTMEMPSPRGKPDVQDFNGKMIFVGPDNLRIGGDKFGPILIG